MDRPQQGAENVAHDSTDTAMGTEKGVSTEVREAAAERATQANDVLEGVRAEAVKKDSVDGTPVAVPGVLPGDPAHGLESEIGNAPETIDDALRIIGSELGRLRDMLGGAANERLGQSKPELLKAADDAESVIDNAANFARELIADLKQRLDKKD